MTESWSELVTRWSAAGVIDADTAGRIRAFEQANAGTIRLRWPIRIALAFGALMLGAGVLLFVSAHWDMLSPATRFGLVLLLVAVFHLAAAASRRFPAMATALHALGTIALGAGIFLGGQIFNLEEHWPGGLMLWTIGAATAWAILREPTQMALTALLAPAWLGGEWALAVEHQAAVNAFRIPVVGIFLLALTYLTATLRDRRDLSRVTLARIGAAALPFAAVALCVASIEIRGTGSLPERLEIVGWSAALGLPLALALLLRGTAAWPHAVAVLWAIVLVLLRQAAGDLSLYVWWALGATGLAAWGVRDRRNDQINLGAGAFAATVLAFYFSQVMDKLGRSASLTGLGLLFLSGGWAIERVRRRLVAQARGGLA